MVNTIKQLHRRGESVNFKVKSYTEYKVVANSVARAIGRHFHATQWTNSKFDQQTQKFGLPLYIYYTPEASAGWGNSSMFTLKEKEAVIPITVVRRR